ncbi:ATP-dependent Clp protease adapter ClpS [Cryobacterium adonitolivorans]|uniref:ATP-dependent Clp protease adapter ClpS n=2 Tax=Cryobacterium adonitolivorans TaxID=1259189 RepID=A0A4R8WE68_9MICO|nr:ATP-dependent Clp protease adapter ClpS [Cryobacterium adonitolivorans]
MSYVSYVFRSYFGVTAAEAERLMLQVHNNGRAIVATGDRESMERHVEAMHGYGLWATLDRSEA